MNTEPIEQHNGVRAQQNNGMIEDVTENGIVAVDTEMHTSDANLSNETDGPITIDEHQPNVAPVSALEQLANQPDEISKHQDMTGDVKEMDMIAFKVFTPNFQQSSYIIGLVEAIVGRTTPDRQDYDLVLQIMGKNLMDFLLHVCLHSVICNVLLLFSHFSWSHSC